MNIRCAFCQTPYTLSRVEMLDALQEMEAHKLTHYDAHCPRCRRATQIPRQRMEMFFPNWRDALKEFEKEMKEHPQQEAPAPDATPAAPVEAAPAPKAEKKVTPKPAEKPAPKAAAKASAAKVSTAKEKAPVKTSSTKAKAPAKKSK